MLSPWVPDPRSYRRTRFRFETSIPSALVMFVLLIGSAAAHGGTSTDTGNDLANLCRAGDKPDGHFEGGICIGFIIGVSGVIDDVCRGANVTKPVRRPNRIIGL